MLGSLNQIEEKALDEFKDNLNNIFKNRIKTMLLYGSKARGDYNRTSDIDVFILIEEGGYEVRDQIADMSYDIFLKYEVLISPRVININEYEVLNRWQTAFIKNLQRDGIKI